MYKTCTEIDKEKVRIVRVKNTLDLEYIYVSEGMIEDIKKNPRLRYARSQKNLFLTVMEI